MKDGKPFAFLLKAVLFIFAKSVGMIYLIQCLQCLAYGLMAASRVYYVDETVGEENEATGQAARGKMILPSFGKEFFPLAVSRFFCPR